ncbi:MAG: EamA family transporter, partial [Enterobacteriaceae bacterium]
LSLLLNGAIINGVSYLWWLKALQLGSAGKIAPLIFLAPVLAIFWLVWLWGELFYLSYAVGLLLCIVAGIVTTLPARQKIT